jgi:hypothetical protein
VASIGHDHAVTQDGDVVDPHQVGRMPGTMRRWQPDNGASEPYVAVGLLLDGRWYVEDTIDGFQCRGYAAWPQARQAAKRLLDTGETGWSEVTA